MGEIWGDFSRSSTTCWFHWIGLRENLQETMVFTIKLIRQIFPSSNSMLAGSFNPCKKICSSIWIKSSQKRVNVLPNVSSTAGVWWFKHKQHAFFWPVQFGSNKISKYDEGKQFCNTTKKNMPIAIESNFKLRGRRCFTHVRWLVPAPIPMRNLPSINLCFSSPQLFQTKKPWAYLSHGAQQNFGGNSYPLVN